MYHFFEEDVVEDLFVEQFYYVDGLCAKNMM